MPALSASDFGQITPANLASALSGLKSSAWRKQTTIIVSAFWDDLITSYTEASNYKAFDGVSIQGSEGRWLGFKHADTADVLIIYGHSLYFCLISNATGTSKEIWQII